MDTNANADQRDGGASAEGSAPSHRAAVRPKFPLQGLVRLVLTELGADDWEMAEGDFWCQVTPPAAPTRVQGWKLHLSATPLSAPEVLHRAAHVLVSGRCQFKFAARAERVEELTSVRYDRAQCGKFITAYPRDDDHFRDLAEALDRATAGLPGPAILSDRPYRKGGLVHYRYGAFGGVPVLTNDGSYEARLQAPDGTAVEDVRRPWFSPPAWAGLPFAGPPGRASAAPATPKPVLLRDRYLVREAIRHSARGGVYRALDQQSGAEVVVKQARSHVAGVYTGLDARDWLRTEAAALQTLAGLGACLVEVFEENGHAFLVETVVPGVPLAQWVQERHTEPGPDQGPPADEVMAMAARLADLLGEVHRRELVYRDFTPNNVMVDSDGQVRLIDPEFVIRPGQWTATSYTPGFAAPECVADQRFRPAPERTSDLFSLGAVLFYLATGINPAFAADDPDPRPLVERLGAVLALVGAEHATTRLLAPAVRGLCAQDPAERWSLDRLGSFLASTPSAAPPDLPSAAPPFVPGPTPLDPARQDRLIEDGLAHVLATMGEDDANRLWPSTGFGTGTDACNVQHGAAGVLTVLTRASRLLGRDDLRTAVGRVASWIDGRRDAVPQVLPGLYFGRAGTAWALHEAALHLGDDALAERAAQLALKTPVRWPNPDVFHGAAGAGMTQLRFWQATGRAEFLDRVITCADGLLEAAEHTEDGVFWPVPADFDSALAGITHLGFAHGVAGVGTFLVAAAQATGRDQYLRTAVAAGATLVGAADRGSWGARWSADRDSGPGEGMLYHLCSGSSGIGTFLLRLWRVTGDPACLRLAEEAADAVHRTRWKAGTAICHGLAGNGDFLLDMAQLRGGAYHAQAEEMASCLYARHAVRNGLLLVPDEAGEDVAVDYGVGLTGVIAFLLRLRHGGPRLLMADADWPEQAANPDSDSDAATDPVTVTNADTVLAGRS